MREYELAVLLHPDLEIDLDKPKAKISKLIEDAGGKIISEDNWGKRKLAYTINKLDFAVYIFYRVELPPEAVSGIEHNLLIAGEVMRHLIIAIDPKIEAAMAAAKARKGENEENREDNDRGREQTERRSYPRRERDGEEL